MNENNEDQKHIAFVFSIIFPGAGFLYQKKWFTGLLFGAFHLILSGLFLYKGAEIMYDRLSGGQVSTENITILILIFMCILFNWIFNIRKIQDYK